MMGGGFGGCTINLIKKEVVNDISEKLAAGYKSKFGIELKTYVTSITEGTNLIS
jgi:galactokinase